MECQTTDDSCCIVVWEPTRKRNSHATGQGMIVQSSQITEPLYMWTDPDLKSGSDAHDLMSTLKKKKGGAKGE